jgi:general secretion pathway protein G
MPSSQSSLSIDIPRHQARSQRGFTLIEMVVVVMIVGILASAAMPLMALHKRRTQEAELRQSLRTIRMAIDQYKLAFDEGRIEKKNGIVTEATGYPPSLEALVKGVPEVAVAASAASTPQNGHAQPPAPPNNTSPFSTSSISSFSTPAAAQKMIYFLRRIPRDPFADPSLPAAQTWGLRSYASPPDAPAAGADVFDVYSKTEGDALDGTPYRQW